MIPTVAVIVLFVLVVCCRLATVRRNVRDEQEAREAGKFWDEFPAPDPAVELALWRAASTWRGAR